MNKKKIFFKMKCEKEWDFINLNNDSILVKDFKNLVEYYRMKPKDKAVLKRKEDYDFNLFFDKDPKKLNDFDILKNNDKILVERFPCEYIDNKILISIQNKDEEKINEQENINKINDNDEFEPIYNKEELEFLLKNGKFFLIKSGNQDNINIAKKINKWATTIPNEAKLNKAFNTGKPVFLIFSVNKIMLFQGFARMITPTTKESGQMWKNVDSIKLGKCFRIEWISLTNLSLTNFGNYQNPMNDGEPLKKSRDTTEIPAEIGKEICIILQSSYRNEPSRKEIFDFSFIYTKMKEYRNDIENDKFFNSLPNKNKLYLLEDKKEIIKKQNNKILEQKEEKLKNIEKINKEKNKRNDYDNRNKRNNYEDRNKRNEYDSDNSFKKNNYDERNKKNDYDIRNKRNDYDKRNKRNDYDNRNKRSDYDNRNKRNDYNYDYDNRNKRNDHNYDYDDRNKRNDYKRKEKTRKRSYN